MKQILQQLDTGKTELIEAPVPATKAGHVLVRTRATLVSAGTERMLVSFGKANLLQKARQQPERVRQVLEKVRTDGLVPALDAVRDKLAKPIPLGYCNAGVVVDLGEGVTGFQVGEMVASNGPHAEFVCVPANLCAGVPCGLVDRCESERAALEAAAFTVIGAVALQGVRLAQPTLGETFAVIGLGLVGQLAVQVLRANGCNVIGVDLSAERVALAGRFGAAGLDTSTDVVGAVEAMTDGHGVDGVLLTAATQSSEPVHQAAQMCRRRGRMVLVGVTGLELRRDDFFDKELTFQVSCSYGPGRYDPDYEQKGRDYPYGFVRWTARRNFEAVLDLMADGRVQVDPLVTERLSLEDAPKLYERLAAGDTGLGTILTYPEAAGEPARTVRLAAEGKARVHSEPAEPVVAVIGAGSFATRTILPALRDSGARLKTIVSRGGTDASVAGRRFGFEAASSRAEEVFEDEEVNAVFVLTPHNTHVAFTVQGLRSGKRLFLEKPLAITPEQLADVREAYAEAARDSGREPLLHVGFNRRFAPLVCTMKRLLDGEPGPLAMTAVVNAGAVPGNHWIQDPEVGGGRIVGEACHFVDLLRFLADAPIADSHVVIADTPTRDTATIAMSFADGSIGTVQYWANGNRKHPKERVEVFRNGKTLVLDNFRRLQGHGWKGFSKSKHWFGQDKGHAAEVREFLDAVRTGAGPLIPFDELVEVTEVTLRAAGKV